MKDSNQSILIVILALVALFFPPLNEPDYIKALANWIPSMLIVYLICLVAACLIMLSNQEGKE